MSAVTYVKMARFLNFYAEFNKNMFSFRTHHFRSTREYKACFEILGVPEDSSSEQIRQAYIQQVKKCHPDNVDGDLEQFRRVDNAFRTLMQRESEENVEKEVDEQRIRHTTPQHRQYLSNDGVGSGTPFERQKQYEKMRVQQAAQNVLEHRVAEAIAGDATLISKQQPLKHDIQTKYGFDRLVEDLIQASMAKGEFRNLRGCGKPLADDFGRNPFTDFTTHKINQVLIDNGFAPEWIRMQKDIRQEMAAVRRDLAQAQTLTDDIKSRVRALNRRIDKFNLIVPILGKQLVHMDLQREATELQTKGV